MKIITTSGGCQGNFRQGLGLAVRSFPSVRGPVGAIGRPRPLAGASAGGETTTHPLRPPSDMMKLSLLEKNGEPTQQPCRCPSDLDQEQEEVRGLE